MMVITTIYRGLTTCHRLFLMSKREHWIVPSKPILPAACPVSEHQLHLFRCSGGLDLTTTRCHLSQRHHLSPCLFQVISLFPPLLFSTQHPESLILLKCKSCHTTVLPRMLQRFPISFGVENESIVMARTSVLPSSRGHCLLASQ